MESLLTESDNLDLNIIVETPSVPEIRRNKPKKKRNKYEKRREKARRAREAAEAQSMSSDVSGNHVEESKQSLVSHENDEKQGAFSSENTVAQQEMATGSITAAKPSVHVDDGKEKRNAITPADKVSQPENHEEDNNIVDLKREAPPSGVVTTTSRRRHDAHRLDTIQNRAKYMAEFHARPLEMDRRSGAVSSFVPSRESQHIFDEDSTDDSWSRLQLHPRIVSTLLNQFHLNKGPTVIQSRAISSLSSNTNHNLFLQSETGSGKTLAYLIPILQSLAIDHQSGEEKRVYRSKAGTRCVVLCPTRELASQTATVAEKLCRYSYSWIVSGCLSGGERRKSEKARIRKGITILIATPGRLLDHLQKTESLLLALKGNLEWLVLDEADRLMDMGLGSQVEQVVQHVRANQPKSGTNQDGVAWRSLLVSATVTKSVRDLAQTMLGGDEWEWARGAPNKGKKGESASKEQDIQNENNISKKEASSEQVDLVLDDSTPRQLKQLHMTVNAKLRLAALVAFLVQRVQNKERTVVFFSTCDSVDYHHALFQKATPLLDNTNNDDDEDCGVFGKACPIHKIHGSVVHAERQHILRNFASSPTASILLATDVAARGLNLPGVDWIVQYDAPSEVADYIHRAGRAARAGRAGHSLLFLLPSERAFLNILQAKGLKEMTALSLASTLNGAAAICKDACGLEEKSTNTNPSRRGEAFGTLVRRRLEDMVLEDDARHQEEVKARLAQTKKKRSAVKPKKSRGELLEMASKAYFSFIRAYPTKEKLLRPIFSARAIHLGHVARSFALREQPTSLSVRDRQKDEKDTSSRKRNASLAFQPADKQQKAESTAVTNLSKKARSSTTMGDHVDPKRARSVLLARAAQLQGGGMDAF